MRWLKQFLFSALVLPLLKVTPASEKGVQNTYLLLKHCLLQLNVKGCLYTLTWKLRELKQNPSHAFLVPFLGLQVLGMGQGNHCCVNHHIDPSKCACERKLGP